MKSAHLAKHISILPAIRPNIEHAVYFHFIEKSPQMLLLKQQGQRRGTRDPNIEKPLD